MKWSAQALSADAKCSMSLPVEAVMEVTARLPSTVAHLFWHHLGTAAPFQVAAACRSGECMVRNGGSRASAPVRQQAL